MAAELLAIPLMIMFFFIMIVSLSILGTIFWIFMLIDCAKRKFKEENEKVVWILVIALTSWIGALIYYFVVKYKDKK